MAAAHVAQAAVRRHRQQDFRHAAPAASDFREVALQERSSSDTNTTTTTTTTPDTDPLSSGFGFQPAFSSTPVRNRTRTVLLAHQQDRHSDSGSTDTERSGGAMSRSSSEAAAAFDLPLFRAPILGYEIMEHRAKFTVFKIKVQHILTHESWFVFRRYTDFLRLNKKLQDTCPGVRLALPPKRWFKDNFDAIFLEERVSKLQNFINGLLSNRDILDSQHVRDFFCFDDPPGPNDSLEESRLRCENLEELVSTLHVELREKEAEVDVLRAELALSKAHRDTLAKSLRLECAIVERSASSFLPADNTTTRRLHQVNVSLANMIENSITLSDHAVFEGSMSSVLSRDGITSSTDVVGLNGEEKPGTSSPSVQSSQPASTAEASKSNSTRVLQNGIDSGSSTDNDRTEQTDNGGTCNGPRRNGADSLKRALLPDGVVSGATDDNGNRTYGAGGIVPELIEETWQ